MKAEKLYSYNSVLTPYLEHLEYSIDRAAHLLGLVFTVYKTDDEDNITSSLEFNEDALKQLVETSKRISSYADKLQNSVNDVARSLFIEFKNSK